MYSSFSRNGGVVYYPLILQTESRHKKFSEWSLIAVPDDRIKAADYIPIKNFENMGSLTNFGVVYYPLVQ